MVRDLYLGTSCRVKIALGFYTRLYSSRICAREKGPQQPVFQRTNLDQKVGTTRQIQYERQINR